MQSFIISIFDNSFLTKNEITEISLYSIGGRKIAHLMNEIKLPGYYEQALKHSRNIHAGSYILRLSTSKGSEFSKIIVMNR